jgi:predicted membrane channel-forming protein YqfA (hemolysin III family)
MQFKIPSRAQSAREEIANSLSHGLGLVGALLILPALISTSVHMAAQAN